MTLWYIYSLSLSAQTLLKISGVVFVLNRGSSLKLHSLLTPSGPVHPQQLHQHNRTNTHMENCRKNMSFSSALLNTLTHSQTQADTCIHSHANTHIYSTQGCMSWSLVVCSHVFAVVDATRHTKASGIQTDLCK